jgi:hypothetical protein
MPSDWGATPTFIDAQATAFPSDEQWANAVLRKNALIADILAMTSEVEAVRDAALLAKG